MLLNSNDFLQELQAKPLEDHLDLVPQHRYSEILPYDNEILSIKEERLSFNTVQMDGNDLMLDTPKASEKSHQDTKPLELVQALKKLIRNGKPRQRLAVNNKLNDSKFLKCHLKQIKAKTTKTQESQQVS